MPRLSMLVPLIRPVNDSAFALSKLYNWLQGGVTCTEGQAFNCEHRFSMLQYLHGCTA
ncbi:MAG TPA: hypothetical protein VFP96_13335 [Candidatus Acidoferrum sp.]|nr:hypothetical protein [Candidatus Acidoferrum sp.]